MNTIALIKETIVSSDILPIILVGIILIIIAYILIPNNESMDVETD